MSQHDPRVSGPASAVMQLSGPRLPAAGDGGLCIGYSVQGRPLMLRQHGDPDAPLRVLLLCGQHGDERAVRRALLDFCRREAERAAGDGAGMQLAVLHTANPDGFAARTRSNAQEIDLNRDHVWLRSPENRAVHRFVARWRPHFVMDLHNYPARREHLVRQGLRLPWDVAIDFPTHPAARHADGHPLYNSLFEALESCAGQSQFRFGRYGLHRAGGFMRHGTPKPGDARNTLALKFDIPVVLLEARNPSRHDTWEDRLTVRAAVVAACAASLKWAARNAALLTEPGRERAHTERIPLRYRWRSPRRVELPFVHLHNKELCLLPCEGYRPGVQGRCTRSAPEAYAVPLRREALIGFLQRHGFSYRLAKQGERFVTDVPSGHGQPAAIPLPGHAIFPFHQTGGRFLMTLLAPESRSSVLTCRELATTVDGAEAPVLRVLSTSV